MKVLKITHLLLLLISTGLYSFREYANIQLTIFEGTHEQIPQALALIPIDEKTPLKYNIVTIGDSNASNADGWVAQLKERMPHSKIVNISQGGRAIGFDNNGRKTLNALKNIDTYLDEAQKQIGNGKYDYLIVCLGTNDTKNMFAERQNEIPDNFRKLLDKIKKHRLSKNSKPRLICVSPPPITRSDTDSKYKGSNERLVLLFPELQSIALEKGFTFIDVYHPLLDVFDYYSPDGVHMLGEGQKIISSQIVNELEKVKE